VPSFGEWGYVVASFEPYNLPTVIPIKNLRFITPDILPSLFTFPIDMQPMTADINRLNNQALVHYYEAEWKHQGP